MIQPPCIKPCIKLQKLEHDIKLMDHFILSFPGHGSNWYCFHHRSTIKLYKNMIEPVCMEAAIFFLQKYLIYENADIFFAHL